MTALCPRCNRESPLTFRASDVNRRISKKTFDYYRCGECDLIYLWPIPADLSDYYTNEYYTVPATLAQLEAGAENERYKIDIVRQFATAGRLLEIGPAYGSFLLLAQKAGYSVAAVEQDARCCAFLSEVAGIKTFHCSEPTDALKDAGIYDIITLWHVIEHLPDPWRTLDSISRSLRPGGILVIAAPNPHAFQFKVLNRYWPHVDAPRHLELIPLPLIETHLKPLGLETEWKTFHDKGTLIWNTFGWEMFFGNITNVRFVKRRLRKIGRILSRLVGPIDRMTDRGSAYTAVFRKR